MSPDYAAIPKVELHVHLEGAAPPALVRDLAAKRGVAIDDLFDAEGRFAWDGFTGFLQAYDRASALFDGPDAWRALAEGALREAAAHGVIYAELFLSPHHVGDDSVAWAEHLAAVGEGAAAAEAATGIVARYIPTCVRTIGPEGARRAAEHAVGADDPRIVGFGMGGDERMHRPADFAPAYAVAREAGLRLTAHAGEFGGPESVRAALDDLGVERIGHGVRAVEDDALVRRLAAERIVLEVCPGSNVSLGLYPDWPSHPIRRLRDAGVSVTVSTDDPPFFGTDMTREYRMLAEAHGFDDGDLLDVTKAGIAAAFCDEPTRAALAARVAAWEAAHPAEPPQRGEPR